MSFDAASLHVVWTVIVVVIFVAVVIWAFGSSRRSRFDEAARIPLEDDDAPRGRD